MVTSSGRTAGIAANSASSISSRGWARVTSHTEMATRWPARTSVPSGGRSIGAASAAVSAARGSGSGGSNSRRDDLGAVVGQVHVEPVAAVIEMHAHQRSSESLAARHRCLGQQLNGMAQPDGGAGLGQGFLELGEAADVAGGDDGGARRGQSGGLARAELRGNLRLLEVVEPGRPAAHAGVPDRDQRQVAHAVEQAPRCGAAALGVQQVAGVLVRHRGGRRQLVGAGQASRGEELGDVDGWRRRPRRSPCPSATTRTRRR